MRKSRYRLALDASDEWRVQFRYWWMWWWATSSDPFATREDAEASIKLLKKDDRSGAIKQVFEEI